MDDVENTTPDENPPQPTDPSAIDAGGAPADDSPPESDASEASDVLEINQDELDALVNQLAREEESGDAAAEPADVSAAPETEPANDGPTQEEQDAVLREMEAALAAEASKTAPAESGSEATPEAAANQMFGAGVPLSADDALAFELPALENEDADATSTLDLLSDVELDVRIELGRTEMYIEDVLRLGVGAVVELNKLAGDPVDVYVNEQLVARGEVLVLNDNFCVRINDIVEPVAAEEEVE